ncbi:hypothetical protein [Scytonema sp. HK-05]|nr:hypothetical protein [Scytonema sp. HK-05]
MWNLDQQSLTATVLPHKGDRHNQCICPAYLWAVELDIQTF